MSRSNSQGRWCNDIHKIVAIGVVGVDIPGSGSLVGSANHNPINHGALHRARLHYGVDSNPGLGWVCVKDSGSTF